MRYMRKTITYKGLYWVNPRSGFELAISNKNKKQLMKDLIDNGEQEIIALFMKSEKEHAGMILKVFYFKNDNDVLKIFVNYPEAELFSYRQIEGEEK